MFTEYETGERELYDLECRPLPAAEQSPNDGQRATLLRPETRLNALRACSGEACRSAEWATTPPPPSSDTTPPRVTSTSPAQNATGVAPSANLNGHLLRSHDGLLRNATTFKLFKNGSTTKISASVGYDAASKKATLNPTNNLGWARRTRRWSPRGPRMWLATADQNTTTGLQQKVWSFTVST